MYNLDTTIDITTQLKEESTKLNVPITIDGFNYAPEVKVSTMYGLVCIRVIKSGSFYVATGYKLDGSNNQLASVEYISHSVLDILQSVCLTPTETQTKENVSSVVLQGNKGMYIEWFKEHTEIIRKEQEQLELERQMLETKVNDRLDTVKEIFKGYKEIDHTSGFIKPPTENAGRVPYTTIQGVGITIKYYIDELTTLAMEVLNAFNGKARAYTFDLLMEESVLVHRVTKSIKDVIKS